MKSILIATSFLLNAGIVFGQSHPKVNIASPASDSQRIEIAKTQGISSINSDSAIAKQNSSVKKSSSSKKCFLKKKKKSTPSQTGYSHRNPSEDDRKLDSIKAIKDKEKFSN